tara:strand:- start:334 stop:594 length:261 start_codon:yes stop_codon:yes gene_type:complete
MNPEEEATRLVKDIHKLISADSTGDFMDKAIKLSILFADKILDQYENKFTKIYKTETIARLVLTNHWNLVKTELNKKLKAYTYEEV